MRIHSQIADIPSARVASSSGSSSLVSAGTVVCALLPVLLLIGIFSLCVKGCHKKRDSSRGSDEAELDQGDAGNTTETDMNNEANGRPVSHDRALPEIPPVPSGVTSTDDDDEEDEGHYDIISKGKKVSARDQLSASAAVAQSSSASGSASKKKNRSHPYEKVRGDPDSDSVYAGIKDELDPAKLPPTGRVGGVMDGVTLHGGLRYSEARSGLSTEASSNAGSIHSNLYATVGTGQRSHSNGFSDDAFRRSSQGLSLPIAASGDSAMGTGLSPTALVPPVPQKMFDPAEEGGGGVSNGRGVPNQLDSSPSLPPRNGDSSNGAVANGSNRMSDGSGRMSGLGIGPGGPLVPSIGPWTAMSAFPSLIINIGDAGSMTSEAGSAQPQTTAKRVPDYSSVTARESLESLRKRQQQQQASQMQVMQFADIDGTYDTINYDQVKMPATPGRLSTNTLTTENVYNNGSDLYAEIGTETNSARSSTYAKVGDLTLPVSSHVSDGIPLPPPPPPSPPPVNTLQQLTHSNLDDQTDPGYSRVDVQRPRSVNSVSTSAVHTSSVPFQHTATGRRSPVYAVVNKSKQSNRQTIHVDENVERGVRQNNSDMNSLANLYAKVSKPKDHRRTSSSGASFVVNDTPSLTSLAFGGARPKVRGQVVGTGHMGEVTRSDHGYASIDNVVNDINKAEDPDYDVVGDGNSLDGLPEYDPNYETVAVSHVPPSGITLRSTVHCGVAHEIMPNGIAHQPRRHMNHIHSASPIWHLPRREHIYEVVKDSSEERDRGERDRGAYNHDSSHATDL